MKEDTVPSAVRSLVSANDPILRRKAQATGYDWYLVGDLFQTMRANYGVGLAAPQIGVDAAAAVIEIDGLPLTIINPLVFWYSDELDVEEESCLSLPGISVLVSRPKAIVLDAVDQRGWYRIGLSGLAARAAQHELDHLAGILITDHAV